MKIFVRMVTLNLHKFVFFVLPNIIPVAGIINSPVLSKLFDSVSSNICVTKVTLLPL